MDAKVINKILKILDTNLSNIKDALLSMQNDEFIQKRKANLKKAINLYKAQKEAYQYKLVNAKDNKDIEEAARLHKAYDNNEKIAREELSNIEAQTTLEIEKYLNVLQIKDIKTQPYTTKSQIYPILFEKITLIPTGNSDNDFHVVLTPFTFVSEL